MKIVTIVGARPQFVKAAVVSRAIAAHNEKSGTPVIDEMIVHTGQHYDYALSQSFFVELEIPAPDVNLGIGSGLHGAMTGAMMAGIETVLLDRRPDLVLVYGDTNSTMAGALAATKLNLPVAHVEAGLRSFNRKMPEEINRIVTDRVSNLLFCPTETAVRHLAAEGIKAGVFLVGDVMLDAAIYSRKKAIIPERNGFALATIHRAENTDDAERLRSIIRALERSPVPVVMPVHPRTRKALNDNGIRLSGAIESIEPISYFSMLGHLDQCDFVVTDSGGLQKEAYFLGKKCITLRHETEWSELVECGVNRVVGHDDDNIVAAFEWAREPMAESQPALYGTGRAGETIVKEFFRYVQIGQV